MTVPYRQLGGSAGGDVCTGIVLGARLTVLRLDAIGISDPKGRDRKNLGILRVAKER